MGYFSSCNSYLYDLFYCIHILYFIMYITYHNTRFLYYTSFLFLLSSLLSYFYDAFYSSIVIFLLFLTSVTHWKRPDNNIIKRIDLFIVKVFGFFYFIYSLYKTEFYRVFFTNIGISIVIFYIIEHVLDFFENSQWIIFHMAVHIYASYISILFLFI